MPARHGFNPIARLTPRSESRLACDRWDRLLLDGFMANQLTTYLSRRAR